MTTNTMRAVRVVGYHQNLEMDEVPVPEPTGPFDVIVKIGGAGVCEQTHVTSTVFVVSAGDQ